MNRDMAVPCPRRPLTLFGLILGLLFAPPAHSQPKAGGDRWALLVGVAEYRRSEFSLLGPVNDIAHMKQMLLQRGFAPDHIRVCRDKDATRQGILQGWDWLQTHVRPGDMALFYYSGHGTVVPPETGAASREMRSALVPYDTLDAGGLLMGKEIGVRIDRLKTNQVVVIVDACHSGRASRLPCVRTRFIPPSRLGLPAEATPDQRRTRNWIYSEFSGAPETQTDAPVPGVRQKELYLGASRVDQTASEDTFLPTKGDYRTNANMGAFTYYLLQEADRDRRNKLTYMQLVERVRADLLRRYGREQVSEDGVHQPTQEPQISGSVPTRPGFLQVAASRPAQTPVSAPPLSVPTVTLADIRAPLRVGVASTLSAADRKTLQKLPNVLLVGVGEPNDVVVESVSDGARVWRARVPLEPCPWDVVPALLSRLRATLMLERLAMRTAADGAGGQGVQLRANDEAAYTEAVLGGGVTLTVTPETKGFATLLVAGADGTLTGVSDVPVTAGKSLSFPTTAKGPVGIDYVQVRITPKRLGLRLPASPGDPRAHQPEQIVEALARKIFASPATGSVDTVLVRIREGR